MSDIAINTTQNVNINFTAANVGLRLGAFFIDLVVKISYVLLVQWLIISNLGLNSLGFDNWTVRSIYIIFFLPVTFYTLAQESMMEGQTIGKKLVGIKVVKIDGYQASFIDYLTRWVFRLIDIVGTSGLVAIISISVTKIYQRLGDIAAGTAVITLKNKINISHTILADISKEYLPSYPQVIRFSDNDIRIIKET
ncbi:MAG: RDD family protein, partial [Saprospiraceae bacterium]